MKACVMIGKQAGVIGLLTLLAKKINVIASVSYDSNTETILKSFNIKIYNSINDNGFKHQLMNCDFLFCIHGKEIVSNEILNLPYVGCINVHPCLYKYKGCNPIGRLLNDGITKASVGIHWMSEDVDCGDVITELFVNVEGCITVVDVYNKLYHFYSLALLSIIDELRIKKGCKK